MNLFNTTEDVIEDRFNGYTIVVGPGEMKSVSDDAGRHMIMRNKIKGLVSLDYGEAEEKHFGSLSEFKKFKKAEGLKQYKDWLSQLLSQEQLFPREVTQKNGGEVELSNTKVPYFKNKIKEVESLLAKRDEVQSEVKETKKMGRPRKVINVEQGTVKSESTSVS